MKFKDFKVIWSTYPHIFCLLDNTHPRLKMALPKLYNMLYDSYIVII